MAEADPKVPVEATEPEASVPVKRCAGPLTWAIRIAVGILLLLFAIWAVLYITKGRFLKSTFEKYASQYAQRDIRVAGDFQLYFDPLNIKFLADGMTVSNPAWRGGQFYTSDHIMARISTFPLVWGEQRIKVFDMAGAKVDLAWDKARKLNTFTFGDPNAPGKAFKLPDIVRAHVVRTTVDYVDPLFLLKTTVRVETVKAQDTKFADDIRFTGDGTLRNRPFTMSGSLMSPNETVAGGRNQLTLAARSGDMSMDVSGTLPGATIIEGADLRVGVRGSNLANLFDFIGVAVPDTRRYRITSNLTKGGGAWKFTGLNGMFGASDLAGAMTITMPNDRLKIDADLRTRKLDIIDAGPFIGYEPNKLAAGSVTAAASTQSSTGGRLLPDAPLRIEAIKRFDADVKYRVATIRAPSMPISNVGLALKLDHSLLQMKPLTFDVAGGKLWSDISINARKAAVFTEYDIRLSDTPLGRLLGKSGVEQAGATGVLRARIQMTGTGDSVRSSLASSNGRIAVIIPKGNMWARNIQLGELDVGVYVQKLLADELKQPVEINCGLVAFTVRDGIAAADPILIDTTKNVILGRGGFSFRNEALDMAVRADGKKFSLFSGQSPIGIEGTFAKPGINIISPQLLTRGGVGLGLGVVASPFAAVLAFVDIGDAKSAQCGPVFAGARATAQRTTGGKPRDDVGRGTTAKSEDGSRSKGERQEQRKKFLGIF